MMFGLIKKDILLARKQLLIVLMIMIFYSVALGIGKSQDYQIGLFSGYLVAIMAILPVSMLAYDEKNKWGRYASSLPVSRKQQVVSKYILMALMIIAAILIFIVAALFSGANIGDIITQLSLTFSTSIMVSSILLTLGYRFGYDKARLIFMGIIFIIVFVMTKASAGNMNVLDQTEQFVKPYGFELMCILFGVLVYIVCCCISVYLYNKKDF